MTTRRQFVTLGAPCRAHAVAVDHVFRSDEAPHYFGTRFSNSTTTGGFLMKLFLVGQYHDNGPWGVVGVFDDEAKAVVACGNDRCFVGPITLNEKGPTEQSAGADWPGVYYPHREMTPQQVLDAPARAES